MVRSMEADTPSAVHPLPSDGTRLRRGCSIEHTPNVDLLLTSNQVNNESVNNLIVEQMTIDDNENIPIPVEARIEGRIIVINETTLPELIHQRHKWEVMHSIRESKLEN